MNNDLGTLSFKQDSSGNWGYCIGGADTVNPFKTRTGNATAGHVLSGKTFSNASSSGLTGTMTNNGAKTASLNCGGSYTIPAGYHNGSGKITANSLASQTSATATAATILSGYTAWVNGVKITGTAKASPKSLSGSVSCGKIQSGYPKTFQVTFSSAFSSVPTVQLNSTGDDYKPNTLKVTNVTKAGFTFEIGAGGSVGEWETLTVTWNAVV